MNCLNTKESWTEYILLKIIFETFKACIKLNRLCLQKKNKCNLEKFTDERGAVLGIQPIFYLFIPHKSTLHLVMSKFPENKIRVGKTHFQENFELLSHLKRIFGVICNSKHMFDFEVQHQNFARALWFYLLSPPQHLSFSTVSMMALPKSHYCKSIALESWI